MRGTLVNSLLLLGAVLTLCPLLWMLSASFMHTAEATRIPPALWPSAPTLEHYRALLDRLGLARALANSALLAAAITALSLLINSMAGYAFAHLAFAGRDRLFHGLLAAMTLPGQVAMLPLFLLLKEMGLVNSYAGVILPGIASLSGIFLIRQYATGLPATLLDAARIDGANEARVWWHIALPLFRPILATLALFTFMGSWNDFLWPLIILSDARLQPLPVALANLAGEHAQDTELMMAGAVLAIAPIVLIFLVLQRHFLRGLWLGGIKG